MNQKNMMRVFYVLVAAFFFPSVAISQTAENTIAKPTKLERILSSDTIGKNYRKLGNLLGKAVSVDEGSRTYIIENCRVNLKTFKNKGKSNKMYDGIIEAVELELSPECSFDITSVFPSLAPQKTANAILVKDLPKDTEFYTQCLMECENIGLGRNEFRYGLKQEDEYLVVDFILDFDANFMAKSTAETLRDEIKKKYPNAKSDDVNCDIILGNWAKESLGNFTFNKIRFGMEDMNRDAMPFCKINE